MGKPSAEECAESPGMSAFGFLSFAMAVVNAVINTANNVNSNNNNNNNNNNDNNNNLVNINIANANNAAGNENMATAGRRRRLQQLRSSRNVSEVESEVLSNPEKFATAIILNGDDVRYKPLKISYTNNRKVAASRDNITKKRKSRKSVIDTMLENVNSLWQRGKRSAMSDSEMESFDLEAEVSFIAMSYIGLMVDGLNQPNLLKKLHQLESRFDTLGRISRKVSQVLAQKIKNMIKLSKLL